MDAVSRLLAALVGLVLLASCGGSSAVRAHLEQRYGPGASAGDTQTWETGVPVAQVTADLVQRVRPAARAVEAGVEHLRYDDDIVLVAPTAGGGSRITAEDLDGRFRDGAYAHLGPGFTPGSPDDEDGGPGDIK